MRAEPCDPPASVLAKLDDDEELTGTQRSQVQHAGLSLSGSNEGNRPHELNVCITGFMHMCNTYTRIACSESCVP